MVGKRAECGSGGHAYGAPTNVGGGILRAVCLRCAAVRLDHSDVGLRGAGLFRSVQRHLLFSPLVEYAALYGHELVETPGFGRPRRGRPAGALARA